MIQEPNESTNRDRSPLLRAIASEIIDRSLEIRHLETRLATLARGSHDEGNLTARLSVQRRELRKANEELKRFGWVQDADEPLQFLHLLTGEAASWILDETGFHKALT